MTDLDAQIRSDLEALAGESRRGASDFAEVAALIDNRGAAYRDERPGVEARRDALVKRRHLELALMPLSLERIFVHRVSRAAAGGAATLGGLVMMICLTEPSLVRLTEVLVPGHVTPTLTCFAIGVFILAAYIAGGWIAERVFESAMRSSAESTADPHGDLDSLARGPIERARSLARGADGWAVGLPLAAVALLVPVMAYLTLLAMAYAIRPFFSLSNFAELIAATGDLPLLALGMIAGVAIAIAAGRACDREHRSLERPRLLAVLSHPIVLPLVVVAALALLALLGSTFADFRAGVVVTESSRMVLSVGGALVAVVPVSWALLWYRRREQRRLETDASV